MPLEMFSVIQDALRDTGLIQDDLRDMGVGLMQDDLRDLRDMMRNTICP